MIVGLAAFNRMRIRQVEKMKPENIVKEQQEAQKKKDNEQTQSILPKKKSKLSE